MEGRPIPDTSGFDDSSSSLTPNLNVICPPTPKRAPAWAFKESNAAAHLRVDSLTSSKVLAAWQLPASDWSLDETRNTSASSARFEPPPQRDKSHVFRPIRSSSMKRIGREQLTFGNCIQNECQVENGFRRVGSTMSLDCHAFLAEYRGSPGAVSRAACKPPHQPLVHSSPPLRSTPLDDRQSTTEHSEAPMPRLIFATTLPAVGGRSCTVKENKGEVNRQMNRNTSTFLSSSTESISDNEEGRPMPDMAAFDDSSSSFTSNFNVIYPTTQKIAPAWALNERNSAAHLRVDRLTSSKVLAACQLSASEVEKGFGRVGSTMSIEDDFKTLGSPLGSGVFGVVYKVRCRMDNCLYAIKRNRRQFRSKRDRDRALKEVQILQRLQTCVQQKDKRINLCPYLLQFVQAWQEDGHLFIQTELCCSDNLGHMMLSLTKEWPTAKKKFPSFLRNLPRCTDSGEDINGRLLPESSVWKICHDVSAGLSHIHSYGIVHHDIKPTNIFFVPHEWLGCICKIGDFGIAGDVGSAEEGQEGDARFMPLELLKSAVKQSSADIFSLGLTLYELASDCQWELPTEGPRWHEIRNGALPPVFGCKRSPELLELLQLMVCRKVEVRPSADKILSEIGAVRKAGSDRDKFLADYVMDGQKYELMRERKVVAAQKAARERCFTPTAAVL